MDVKFNKILAIILSVAVIIGLSPNFTMAGPAVVMSDVAGDINNDHNVNNKDLTRLFQYLSGWNVSVNEDALDVNGDTKVNNKDLTRLFQYLSDWDVQIHITPHCDHAGETEIRGYKASTCTEEGYSGDTYCLICERRIAIGEVTPALSHTGGVATCHSKAVCTRCGKEYGELNPDNHSGGTELRNYQAATCGEGGYSGDTYCLGCGKVLLSGENTNPTYNHKHTAIQNAKESTCWALGYTGDLVCLDCGMVLEWGTYINESDIHLHTHIENAYAPTCTAFGFTGDTYCDDCGKCIAYGTQLEPTGHLHTELRNNYPATCTTAGYTGDTYCTECDTFIESGVVIEPTGHKGESATYYRKGICEVCDEEYYKDICAYDQLNQSQKQIYDILDTAINSHETDWINIPFEQGMNSTDVESDIKVAFHAVSYDRPEYFWMPRIYIIIHTFDKPVSGKLIKTEVSFTAGASDTARGYYNMTADTRASMQAELDQKIEEILALAQNYETDFEKELFLHDYLCENIVYDNDSAGDPENADYNTYTVYGALVNGTCVCEGYSRAMQLLCGRLGISCGLVTGLGWGGKVVDGYQIWEPHMWNIIRIGDGIYYLDVTFDDLPSNTIAWLNQEYGFEINYLHNYFNITTEKLKVDHALDDMLEEGIDYSDGLDFNFFEIYEDATEYYYYTTVGAYIYENDATDAAQFALENCNEGQTTIDFKFSDSINANTARTLLKKALIGKDISYVNSGVINNIWLVRFSK